MFFSGGRSDGMQKTKREVSILQKVGYGIDSGIDFR